MATPNRKLIVCCDGTWNQPNEPGGPSNVVKMVRAIRPIDDSDISQLVYYHPGVGTGNVLDRFVGGTMGVGLSGNVQSAYGFLVDNFVDGDEIFLFGFSRGAYTVRSLAGLIGLVGILEKIDMELFLQVYAIYRSKKYRTILTQGTDLTARRDALRALFPAGEKNGENEKVIVALDRSRPTNVFFIGVWDTVGALGVPYGPMRWIGRSLYNFHDTDLSERVNYAYHALAIDEARGAFKPSLWTRPKGRGEATDMRRQVLEQVWFAGVHSNVGGGYAGAGLSDIAFIWMASKAAAASEEAGDRPLALDEEYLKMKIDRTMGFLENSRKGLPWNILPKYMRPILAAPPEGKETCENIHQSVLLRYQCAQKAQLAPFPYRPRNVEQFLRKPDGGNITSPSAFETKYRP